MNDIPILDYSPIVFTKDTEFIKRYADEWRSQPGAIILLPPDAVLAKPIEVSDE